MLSDPFFGDQPHVARRGQELGLALPLADAPRGPVEPRSVEGADEVILARREAFTTRPDQARRWELNVIEGRAEALDRRLALVRSHDAWAAGSPGPARPP